MKLRNGIKAKHVNGILAEATLRTIRSALHEEQHLVVLYQLSEVYAVNVLLVVRDRSGFGGRVEVWVGGSTVNRTCEQPSSLRS